MRQNLKFCDSVTKNHLDLLRWSCPAGCLSRMGGVGVNITKCVILKTKHVYVIDPEVRAIVTISLSIGWRMPSSMWRRNSGSSSRNRIPWCARDPSPGSGTCPPPINATSGIVWRGARNGRLVAKAMRASMRPAARWIWYVEDYFGVAGQCPPLRFLHLRPVSLI
jgi:hypothetical protein